MDFALTKFAQGQRKPVPRACSGEQKSSFLLDFALGEESGSSDKGLVERSMRAMLEKVGSYRRTRLGRYWWE